ncbi:S8 family peptidase [Halosolutus gelatinilyticus]|uniref:S8 family peptidase n=1 Tax=Halosolutus gelatinilyticus TaxID=2931975 RepID=UPI001FF23A9E|nr:S8 family peptidase [Halosolutus gelatinilyticus]
MSNNNQIRRRNVLRTIGGSAALGLAGTVAASEELLEINVGFDDERGAEVARAEAAGGVKREFAFGAVTIDVPETAAKGLKKNPHVEYVEKNGEMRALDDYPWGIERVEADVAHDSGYGGAGASVSVIDTGIDSSHSDLEGNVAGGACFSGCSEGCETCWDDDNGHGTHVAGTAGAALNGDGVVGVGPDVDLYGVKVLDGNGTGTYSDIAAGIEWTADQGIDVANLSLGGRYSGVIHDACRYAAERGVLLVAAAGNGGCATCISYPAAFEECIAVSATDRDDTLANFSASGPEIELVAPGVDVLSTYPDDDYQRLSGTSMAAPHVAGAGAQLMATGLSRADARQRLRDTADDIGLPAEQQGYGLVNVRRALWP